MTKPLATSKRSLVFLTLISAFFAGCDEEPDTVVNDQITGIEVSVHYDPSLSIDQLNVQGWKTPQEAAFENALLPEHPQIFGGEVHTFALLLPNDLATTTIRVAVDAYFEGEIIAAGQQQVTLELANMVKVNIRLSPDNVCETDADNDGICDQNDPCIDMDGDGFGSDALSLGCPQPGTDLDDTNWSICADTDQDRCDDCSGGTFDPANDGEDSDDDGICDLGDTCSDADGDGLGIGTLNNSGCLHETNDSDDTNDTVCADTDDDTCDDCSRGSFNPAEDGEDDDSDGTCNLGDSCTDVDGDGLGIGTLNNSGCLHETNDSNDANITICTDTDGDTCDDCSGGSFDPAGDGEDGDNDGICNLGDTCTDADGDGLGIGTLHNEGCLSDINDSNDTIITICADTDGDTCDDCSNRQFNPAEDGEDGDNDGICNLGDTCTDADGDGLGIGTLHNAGCLHPTIDSNDTNITLCSDIDGDTCDDCSSRQFNPAEDGEDGDGDGICNLGDTCTDADGDGLGIGTLNNIGCLHETNDSNDAVITVCADTDHDGCSDCASERFNPTEDGEDGDSDGICNLGDTCTDADGDGLGIGTLHNQGCLSNVNDSNDSIITICADTDDDGCNDCSNRRFNPTEDGEDGDNDGICDLGDTCTDADGDGLGIGTLHNQGCLQQTNDSNDAIVTICADIDEDGCNDCTNGMFNTQADGADGDGDGICNLGDTCTDADGDGLGIGTLHNQGCLHPIIDSNDASVAVCADTDGDGCDDCSNRQFNPAEDGEDGDGDGICDRGDTCTDADGDGLGMGTLHNVGCLHQIIDANDGDITICADIDGDTCDDCSNRQFNPTEDGEDGDHDGICNLGDPCTDADGDGLGIGTLHNQGCLNEALDSNDANITICADTDEDGCNDCANHRFNPYNDGEDSDGDGICDAGDTCEDQDEDGVCAELDCDDTNRHCGTICTDNDRDGYCSDQDCDETYSTCTDDCTTNSDAAMEPTPTVDCIEHFCGSDPTDGSSNCYIVNTQDELADAIESAHSGETNILVGDTEINGNLPNIQTEAAVTITQIPQTSITLNSNRLFRVRGRHIRFENLVIYVERANTVFELHGKNTELNGVSIISIEEDQPQRAVLISSAGNLISNSKIVGFGEQGIQIKGSNANDNQILDTIVTGGTNQPQIQRAAVLIEDGSRNSIIGSVLVDNTVSAIMLRRAKNTMVAHNTIANNFNGITFTSNNAWNSYETWKSINTCIRNNSVTGNNSGLSQLYTYTTWNDSEECAVYTDWTNAYGNNSYDNGQTCSPTCTGLTPFGEFWEYEFNPQYRSTTMEPNSEPNSVPVDYYCLGNTTRLWDGARNLDYDRNGSQPGNYNGNNPDVGGRETGTPACPLPTSDILLPPHF